MICEDCHQRAATTAVTENKEPLFVGIDPKKGRGPVVRQVWDECAKKYPPSARQ